MAQQGGTSRGEAFDAHGRASLPLFLHNVRDYAIVLLDPDGAVIAANRGVESVTGYAEADLLGAEFSFFYTDEHIARGTPGRTLAAAREAGSFENEARWSRRDGNRFWAQVLVTAIRDERDATQGFSVVARDCSERRAEMDTLRHNEARFRSLIEGVKDYAIFLLDPQGVVASWNEGTRQIKGYEAQDIIGSHFSRFYPREALERGLPEEELHVATRDGRFEDEGWRLRKDGSRFWANVIITAIRDSAGTLIGFSKITRDLTERKAHEERLKDSEERFRLLVEGVAEYAIIMLDATGTVTSWNSGGERIYGYQAPEILGRHWSNFFSAEDVTGNKPWRQLAKAREQGQVADEGWRARKTGNLFWAGTIITALCDATGRACGFAVVTQDLTPRRDAEALADMAKRMQEFIAMLAHELRNPLAPIRNAVALMGQRGIADPTFESMRLMIDRQCTYLARLLDDLLEVNRIARGELSIDRQPMDVLEVLRGAAEAVRAAFQARSQRLQLTLPELPLYIIGDPVRLSQAFVNILNNANRYTPEGGEIAVVATVRRSDVEIKVRDTGRGIAADQIERIFELFTQIEPKVAGGLGVGLALVRRVVDLHAGTIQAISAGPGTGTAFVMRLPFGAPTIPIARRTQPAAPGRPRSGRVLVVDDNRDAAVSLGMLLESLDQDVRVAYDARSAIEAAAQFQPEIAFLDIGLPDGNGYEVAQRLKHASQGPLILVAVTGWGQDSDRKLSLEAGFDHHLVKPSTQADIHAILKTLP